MNPANIIRIPAGYNELDGSDPSFVMEGDKWWNDETRTFEAVDVVNRSTPKRIADFRLVIRPEKANIDTKPVKDDHIANLADTYIALSNDLRSIQDDIASEQKAFLSHPDWLKMSLIVEYNAKYASMWNDRYDVYKKIGYLTKDAKKVTDAILAAKSRLNCREDYE